MTVDFLAQTPQPPYVAVIFTSVRAEGDHGYGRMADAMVALAAEQPGFLGIESAREGSDGITVSYWADLGAARAWKQVAAHLVAQERGRAVWYRDYRVRVATVEREYGRDTSELASARRLNRLSTRSHACVGGTGGVLACAGE